MGSCAGKISPSVESPKADKNTDNVQPEMLQDDTTPNPPSSPPKPAVDDTPPQESHKEPQNSQVTESLENISQSDESNQTNTSDVSQQAHIRNFSGMREEEDVYHGEREVDPLEAFRGLFLKGSVWTGICEWPGDGTSLALEFSVVDPPDENGKFSVTRLCHVKTGKHCVVDDIDIVDQESIVREIIFKYHEDTPDGMELILSSNGRHDGQEINLRRAYVRGLARKRSLGDTDEAFIQGNFDFVRTYAPSSQRAPTKQWLDFDTADNGACRRGSPSPGRIAERIYHYSKQFDVEMKTGRSTSIPKSRR